MPGRSPRTVLALVVLVTLVATTAHADEDLRQSPLTFWLLSPGHWVAETHLDGFTVKDDPNTKGPHDERIARELVPAMQRAAAEGVEAARWQLGLVSLFGWYGVPRDVARARALLATAPAERQRAVTFALAQAAYLANDLETAERLFLQSYDEGLDFSDWYLCWVAQEWTSAKRTSTRRDLDRADRVMAHVWPLASREANCNLALGQLRFRQGRRDELYVLGTRAAALVPPGDHKREMMAWSLRVIGAFTTDEMTRLPPEVLIELLRKPFEGTALLRWGPWGVLLLVLGLLCGWTWKTRARPMGLMLSWAWGGVLLLSTGLSLLVPFPVLIDADAGPWVSGVIAAVACVAAARLRGWKTPYGDAAPRVPWRQVLWAMGLVTAVLAFEAVYGAAYEALFGVPLQTQMVAALLRVAGPADAFWTLLFAAVFVPFVEEFAFRGFLFDAFQNRWGPRVALIGTSVLFGLAHVELTQSFSKVPLIIVFGLGLALLRSRTGNLRASVLAHGVNNGLAVVLLSLS